MTTTAFGAGLLLSLPVPAIVLQGRQSYDEDDDFRTTLRLRSQRAFRDDQRVCSEADECFDLDINSQHAACFLLAIRSASLLRGMEALLRPDTFDSWDVLMRAFLESRDILLTFRFDDEGTRKHIRGQGRSLASSVRTVPPNIISGWT